MPSSANISRENAPLSGSSPSDIEGAERQSPVNPRSFDVVSIERCGNKNDNPCQDIRLYLYNVMGQEDYFRQEEGDRIFNYGIGRVVVSTNIDTDIDLEYKRNPANEDNPNFDESVLNVSTGQRYHEFFFPVDPNTTYAFRVKATSVNCPETDEWSGVYYLFTSDKVKVDTKNQLETEPTLLFLPLKEYCQNTSTGTSSFAGIAPVWYAQNKSTSHTLSTNANIVSMTSLESSFSTNYTIQ